jgi:hypothetical protein
MKKKSGQYETHSSSFLRAGRRALAPPQLRRMWSDGISNCTILVEDVHGTLRYAQQLFDVWFKPAPYTDIVNRRMRADEMLAIMPDSRIKTVRRFFDALGSPSSHKCAAILSAFRSDSNAPVRMTEWEKRQSTDGRPCIVIAQEELLTYMFEFLLLLPRTLSERFWARNHMMTLEWCRALPKHVIVPWIKKVYSSKRAFRAWHEGVGGLDWFMAPDARQLVESLDNRVAEENVAAALCEAITASPHATLESLWSRSRFNPAAELVIETSTLFFFACSADRPPEKHYMIVSTVPSQAMEDMTRPSQLETIASWLEGHLRPEQIQRISEPGGTDATKVYRNTILPAWHKKLFSKDAWIDALELFDELGPSCFAAPRDTDSPSMESVSRSSVTYAGVTVPLKSPIDWRSRTGILRTLGDVGATIPDAASLEQKKRAFIRLVLDVERRQALADPEAEPIWRALCAVVDVVAFQRRYDQTPRLLAQVIEDGTQRRRLRLASGVEPPARALAARTLTLFDPGEWFEADMRFAENNDLVEITNIVPRPDIGHMNRADALEFLASCTTFTE